MKFGEDNLYVPLASCHNMLSLPLVGERLLPGGHELKRSRVYRIGEALSRMGLLKHMLLVLGLATVLAAATACLVCYWTGWWWSATFAMTVLLFVCAVGVPSLIPLQVYDLECDSEHGMRIFEQQLGAWKAAGLDPRKFPLHTTSLRG